MKKILWAALSIMLLVASCKSTDNTNIKSPLATPIQLFSVLQSPVATSVPLATAVSIPTQDSRLATIEGTIAMEGYPVGMLPATLFLGDPTGSNPVGAYIALDINTAPRGYVKPDGNFVFPNVPKGTFCILVWTAVGSYIVPNPATGHTWLIEIKGNERFNTGHISVSPSQFSP
jgi:hypothetical protein